MVKRILSGVVGISFIIAVIVLSGNIPVIIDIFVAAVCAIAVGEFANATGTLKHWQISFPSMAFAVVYPMLMNYDAMLIVGYAYTAVMLSMMIFCHKKISFREFAYIYSMSLFCDNACIAVACGCRGIFYRSIVRKTQIVSRN